MIMQTFTHNLDISVGSIQPKVHQYLPYTSYDTVFGFFPNLAFNLGIRHLTFFKNLSFKLGCWQDLLRAAKVVGTCLKITACASIPGVRGVAKGGNIATGVEPASSWIETKAAFAIECNKKGIMIFHQRKGKIRQSGN